MILPLEQLQQQLEPAGIRLLYSNSGRFDFARAGEVHRRCLLVEPDPSIRADLQSQCVQMHSAGDVAAATAGHLAEIGAAPLYLLPHIHWEHEMLDHAPRVWEQVLELLGESEDDPMLTGGNALVLEPRQTPLAKVIETLLEGLTDASAMLLSPLPLIVKIHPRTQVWFSSTDETLLPKI